MDSQDGFVDENGKAYSYAKTRASAPDSGRVDSHLESKNGQFSGVMVSIPGMSTML